MKQSKEEGVLEGKFGSIWYAVHGSKAAGIPLLVLHGGPGAPMITWSHWRLSPTSAR